MDPGRWVRHGQHAAPFAEASPGGRLPLKMWQRLGFYALAAFVAWGLFLAGVAGVTALFTWMLRLGPLRQGR